MPVTITEKDNGWKKLKKAFQEKKAFLTVGIHGSAGSDEVLIGTVHEFGSPERGIPERSYLRSTFEEKREALYEQMETAIESTLEGVPLGQALGRIGLGLVAAIQGKIRSNIAPPLKQETIDRKGSSVALIDTGRLINSITSVAGVK